MNSGYAVREAGVLRTLLAPLKPYLDDPSVTELSIRAPGGVWTQSREGWRWQAIEGLTAGYLSGLRSAILTFNGLDHHPPIRDGVLPDGERVHIVTPPAVIEGTRNIAIRKHVARAMSWEELAAGGCFEEAQAVRAEERPAYEAALQDLLARRRIVEFLRLAVASRLNIVLAGATGSGKTNLMRTLLNDLPRGDVVLTVEDVHELPLPAHPLAIHMLYGDGAGRVSACECLRSALRQSPRNIIVAELRGAEALDYLESLATGHPGGVTSVHANRAGTVYGRIVSLVRKAPAAAGLALADVERLVREVVDVVVYMEDWRVREILYEPEAN